MSNLSKTPPEHILASNVELEALPGEFQAGGAKHSPSKIYDYAYQKGTQEPMGNPNKNPGDPKNPIFHDREPIAI